MSRLPFASFALIGSGIVLIAATALGQQAREAQTAVAAPSGQAVTVEADAHARSVLASSCTACHDLGVLTAQPHAAADWPVILNQMVANGASVTDDEFKLLEAYLARTYSAPATSG